MNAEGKIIDFSLPTPLTEFAPTYKFYGWGFHYENQKNCDIMRNWILNNKQRIIDEYPADKLSEISDGGTGLGSATTTARYQYYNLFHETRNIKAFIDFRKRLYVEYCAFMDQLKYIRKECNVHSWMNVMDVGQDIKVHNHGTKPWHYLSGNVHLDNYETHTYYLRPIDKGLFKFNNVKGGTMFFPSQMYHGASKFNSLEGKRVSMAFDLYPKKYGQTDGKNIYGVQKPDEMEYPIVDLKVE